GLIVLLQIWGLDVRSLAILASVLGVGIGFGVQNITNNLISGLIITLERPIQVGDFVKVGELVGTVERIGARSTEIRTLDQVAIIVPNSRFLETEVINWSHGDPVSRLKLTVPVAYGSDIKKVQAALLEAAKNHPEVLVRPQPQVWFQGFGDCALNFDLLVWTGEPHKQYRVKSDLYYRIEASLRRYGIEVPFPQRDLHVRSPQLEELLTTLLQKNAPMRSENREAPIKRLYSPNGNSECLQNAAGAPSEDSIYEVATSESGEELTAAEVEELVAAMRGEGGLAIADRRYRLNLYPACFIGSEAVEWLVHKRNCTREEAIDLGQLLVDWGIIHHVLDEHPFRDGYFFYRFYADEQ
ncbi:MAG: mechanosensitive ion channel, partial [Coleofasciculus sp. S288]|nr:mechanosensitive ion channel [Coleofasciculus sp. S288]